MKKILIFSMLLALVAGFTSCNGEEHFPGSDEAARPTNNDDIKVTYTDNVFTQDDDNTGIMSRWLYGKYYTVDKGTKAFVTFQFEVRTVEEGETVSQIITQVAEYEFKGHTEEMPWAFIRIVPEVVLFEDFEEVAVDDRKPLRIDGWLNTRTKPEDISKGKSWERRDFSKNGYAYLHSNDKNAEGIVIETWLVTPAMVIETGFTFSFDYQFRYYAGNPISVYISTSFSGKEADITTTEWTDITSEFAVGAEQELDAQNHMPEFLPAGTFDLAKYEGKTIYIAFKYSGENSVTTTAQLDNIRVGK